MKFVNVNISMPEGMLKTIDREKKKLKWKSRSEVVQVMINQTLKHDNRKTFKTSRDMVWPYQIPDVSSAHGAILTYNGHDWVPLTK